MNLKVYSVIVNNLILMKPYNCWKLYKETRNHSLNVIYEVIFMVVAQLKSMVSFLDAYWDTNTVSFCSFSAQNTKMCIFFYCLQIVERNKNSQPRVFSDVVFCYIKWYTRKLIQTTAPHFPIPDTGVWVFMIAAVCNCLVQFCWSITLITKSFSFAGT